MKKLKLNLQQFEGVEVLTRSQLKKVLGGDSGSGAEGCSGSCDYQWTDAKGNTHTTTGTCMTAQPGNLCYCSNGGGTCSGK
jgi:hypothetical protein